MTFEYEKTEAMAFREKESPYFCETLLKLVQFGFSLMVFFTVHTQFIHLQDVQ